MGAVIYPRELARALHVSERTVRRWFDRRRTAHGMPLPVVELDSGRRALPREAAARVVEAEAR